MIFFGRFVFVFVFFLIVAQKISMMNRERVHVEKIQLRGTMRKVITHVCDLRETEKDKG